MEGEKGVMVRMWATEPSETLPITPLLHLLDGSRKLTKPTSWTVETSQSIISVNLCARLGEGSAVMINRNVMRLELTASPLCTC